MRRVDLGAPNDHSSANDTYIDGIVGSLLNDPSPYALRGDPGRLRRLCAAVFDPSFDNPKSAAKLDTSMRMWQAYTIEMGTDCWRPDAADLDSFGRKREKVLCAGFLPWALTRMRGRRGNQRALPQSAFKNFLGVVKGHDQLGIAMVSTKLVKYTLKRLCMRHIYDYGAQSMIPKRREPMTRSMILALTGNPGALPHVASGTKLGRTTLEWATPLGRALRAALLLGARTGVRKAEISLDTGQTFDSRCASRANLRLCLNGRYYTTPPRELLLAISHVPISSSSPLPCPSQTKLGRSGGKTDIHVPAAQKGTSGAWELGSA